MPATFSTCTGILLDTLVVDTRVGTSGAQVLPSAIMHRNRCVTTWHTAVHSGGPRTLSSRTHNGRAPCTTQTTASPAGQTCTPGNVGPRQGHEKKMKEKTMLSTITTHAGHEAAVRELRAAQTEVDSLGTATSPSRLERALERLEAARAAMILAA